MILGAFVIGTTSTKEKADIAKACGADEVIIYSEKDFVQEVNRITESAGVNAHLWRSWKSNFQQRQVVFVRDEINCIRCVSDSSNKLYSPLD